MGKTSNDLIRNFIQKDAPKHVSVKDSVHNRDEKWGVADVLSEVIPVLASGAAGAFLGKRYYNEDRNHDPLEIVLPALSMALQAGSNRINLHRESNDRRDVARMIEEGNVEGLINKGRTDALQEIYNRNKTQEKFDRDEERYQSGLATKEEEKEYNRGRDALHDENAANLFQLALDKFELNKDDKNYNRGRDKVADEHWEKQFQLQLDKFNRGPKQAPIKPRDPQKEKERRMAMAKTLGLLNNPTLTEYNLFVNGLIDVDDLVKMKHTGDFKGKIPYIGKMLSSDKDYTYLAVKPSAKRRLSLLQKNGNVMIMPNGQKGRVIE